MDFDVITVLLSVLVFVLYMIALALFKYLKAHNCIPNNTDIEELRNNIDAMMNKGLEHDKTLKDIQSLIEITKQRKMTI